MSWARFDDNFGQHPKIVALPDGAFRLHVLAICYCARHETDGLISTAVARMLVGPRGAKLAVMLAGARLWEHVDGDMYRIHDYLEYNPSRAQAESKRNAKAIAGAKGAASRWHSTPTWQNDAPVPVPDPIEDDVVSRSRTREDGGYADLYWRHMGHEATAAQVTELENAEFAGHPRTCIEWVVSEVGAGDLRWRNMKSIRMKLGDCAKLGQHGPRALNRPQTTADDRAGLRLVDDTVAETLARRRTRAAQ